jgi:ABC-type multidrug transport system ATPase subunit
VLAGLDLRAHRGEVLALLGPDGAGKTTTIEILEVRRASPEDTYMALVHRHEPGDMTAAPVEFEEVAG